jgi:hypothetical protein
LEDALSLRFGRTAAGILLAIGVAMDLAGQTHLWTTNWDDVPRGAHLQDVSPDQWLRVLSIKWADDPPSREVGLIAAIITSLGMLLPSNVRPDDLAALASTRMFVRLLRMQELPERQWDSRQLIEDLTTVRSLLSPDMMSRPHALTNQDFVGALRSLSELLGSEIKHVEKDAKP